MHLLLWKVIGVLCNCLWLLSQSEGILTMSSLLRCTICLEVNAFWANLACLRALCEVAPVVHTVVGFLCRDWISSWGAELINCS